MYAKVEIEENILKFIHFPYMAIQSYPKAQTPDSWVVNLKSQTSNHAFSLFFSADLIHFQYMAIFALRINP